MSLQQPTTTWRHPEILDGEVFFRNMNSQEFDALQWTSKRKGQNAYDGEGRQLTAPDWFPVFLAQAELVDRQTNLSDLRRQLHDPQERRAA